MKLEPLKDERIGGRNNALISDLPNYEGFDPTEHFKGFKSWRNPHNRLFVAQVHYSADPKKDTDEFRERARSGISYVQYMREYEIVDCSFEGIPVFMDDFSQDFHVSKEPLVWNKDYPMIRGWDFGLGAEGNACLYAQVIPPLRIMCYYEVTSTNVTFERFADENKRISEERFSGAWKWIDCYGPEGDARSQNNGRSNAQTIRDVFKTRLVPGEKLITPRLKSVRSFLHRHDKGLPAILLDPNNVPILKDGFTGGYHYKYKLGGRLHETPDKNEYSNIHDALQAIATRAQILDSLERSKVQFATPSYGNGKAA